MLSKSPFSDIIYLDAVVGPVSSVSACQSVGRGFETRLKHESFLQCHLTKNLRMLSRHNVEF